MKTEQEIKKMKEDISNKISTTGDKARACVFGSAEYEMHDREYAKSVAQYNILLEVLDL